ncbi:chromosome partition protein Smc-like [Panonychus citri]|uniref:chromosome partition protein Smc-like n=1 Tax=Panonychus citri TaxID=50023 RepID=UPI002307733B|nr:chromosome partition protein Smc-like [Panonychus citri]
MDSSGNNFGSKMSESEVTDSGVDVGDLESIEEESSDHADFNCRSFKRRVFCSGDSYENLKKEDLLFFERLEREKDLKRVKNKYLTDLSDFGEKIQSHHLAMKRKSEVKNELYNSIDKIIAGLKSQIDSCSDITSLTLTINENLSTIVETESSHYNECINFFGAFANRGIDVYGYSDKSNLVEKVNMNSQRSTADIATDCVKVLNFLKENGPYDAYEDEITSLRMSLIELHEQFEELRVINEMEEQEIEKLDKDLTVRAEKKKLQEQQEAEAKKAAIEAYEAAREKLVVMICSNTEKQKQYAAIGEKIDFMRVKIKELPECEQKLDTLHVEITEKDSALTSLKAKNEETKAKISAEKENIEALKKKAEIMDKENAEKVQNLESKVNNMESELHDKQVKLKESNKKRERAREEYEKTQTRLQTIESRYKTAKDEARRQKVMKKKNMKEKRKLKEQLTNEITMLSLSLGISPV